MIHNTQLYGRIAVTLFLFLLGRGVVPAQTSAREEVKDVYFNLIYTYKSGDTIVGILDNARNLGITNGTFVKAWQSERPEIPGYSAKKEFEEKGVGRIILHDTLVSCYIKLYHAEDTLEAGDMVSVRVSIPLLPQRSVFSDLVYYNVFYTNADREPLYHIGDILLRDNKQLEDSIYNAIIKDLKATYERVKDRTDLPASLLAKNTAGRFKGRIPLEVIRDVTRADLEAFFLYVKTYWLGYIGKQYRASESFAGWLVSNSPYSYPEVKNALMPIYRNKASFAKLLPQYKDDIIKEGSVKSLINDVIDLNNVLRHDEAHEVADFAIALGEAVKDTAGLPWAYMAKAQTLQHQNRFAEALTVCEKVIKAAVPAKDKDIELQAINKKAFCQYKISKYKESWATLDIAAVKLKAYRSQITDAIYDRTELKIYEYRSGIYYKTGEYEKALAYLDTSIAINNKVNTYEAQIANAEHYKFKGDVYNDQGKPAKALEAFRKAEEIYRGNKDQLNRGLIANDIAYSYHLSGEYEKSTEIAVAASDLLLELGDYNDAGYSYTVVGGNFWELGMYDSAVAAHKKAIGLRQKAGNDIGQGYSWKKIGNLYLLSGQKPAALNAFDSSAYYYQLARDQSGLGDVYNEKGQVYLNDESYKKATEFFEKARGINSKTTVEALFNLGTAWWGIDAAKAEKYYEESREKSVVAGNTAYQFASAQSLAQLAWGRGDTVKGDRYFGECLELNRQINTEENNASCLAMKAYRFRTVMQMDSALALYDAALKINERVNKSHAVSNYSDQADIFLSTGDFRLSEAAYTKAIEMARDASNAIALGNGLNAITFLYGRTGEYEKGMVSSDSALAIFHRSGNIIRQANTYSSLASLLNSKGEYHKSIVMYLLADSIYKAEGLNDSRAVIQNNIGVVYLGQKDYVKALKYFELSAAMIPKGVVNESYLLTQGNIADCYTNLKRIQEAELLLNKILPKARQQNLHRIATGMALTLGSLYFDQGKLKEAEENFKYVADHGLRNKEVEKSIEALTYLARIHEKTGNKDLAERDLRQAISVIEQYNPGQGWESYYEMGLLYFSKQRFDSAIGYFRKAVDKLDKNTENLYGGEEAKKIFTNDPRKADLYNKITFAYFSLGNVSEAWAYANRGNIAGMKELSGSLSLNSNDSEKNEALKKLLNLQQSKKALENTAQKQEGENRKETLKKIEILEADYNNFLQDVLAKYEELGIYFSRTNADEFNSYKTKIPADLAVILYVLNDKTLMIFSLTNEKLAVDTMTADAGPLVLSFIESIKNTKKQTGTGPLSLRSDPQDEDNVKSGVEFKDASGQLYDILIAPVYDKIKSKKRFCIIPTGVFSNMPFQCLGQNVSAAEFHFLIENHSIFYTNKMSMFNTPHPARVNRDFSSFAAFGVPDPTLKFNIDEVKAIGKIIGVDSTIYTDGRATESLAKHTLRNKKIIHFATHGVLSYSSDFSQSYLKLLPDKDTSDGNNGKLTMREVQRLGITDCDMVILSACQTAVSKELVRGWNMSPANSFLISNVKTVLAGLWKVADEPTSLLLEYFYENLSGMDKSEALRQAQIRLSKDPRFTHPNYWGAFVLYGDWN